MSLSIEALVRSCDPAAVQAAGAWREVYRDVVPSIFAYLRAQRVADPQGAVVHALRRAADRSAVLHLGGESLRSWIFVSIHHALIRARRSAPLGFTEPFVGTMDLLDDLTRPERDVVLLRVLGGLSVDAVAQAMRKRRRTIEVLQARAIDVLRERVSDAHRNGSARTTHEEADALLSGSVPSGSGLVPIALLLHGLRDEHWEDVPVWVEDQHVAMLTETGSRRAA